MFERAVQRRASVAVLAGWLGLVSVIASAASGPGDDSLGDDELSVVDHLPDDGLPQPSPTPVVPDVAALGWEPVLDEDFEDGEVDETVWKIHEGPGVTGGGTFTRDAVRVEDGNLTLTTYTEEIEDDEGNVNLKHYTGEVRAGHGGDGVGFMGTYGYVEARIRLNNAPATRSAFWMLSPTWHNAPVHDPAAAGPEIDIFEERDPAWGDRDPQDGVCDYQMLPLPCDEIGTGGFHWNGFDENHATFSQRVQWDGPSPQGNFLTYGLLWTPDGYWMFRDGRMMLHSEEAITYNPEYVILSQHNWGGHADVPDGGYGSLEESEVKMEVDHVRMWQRPVAAVPDQTVGVGEPVAAPFSVTDFTSGDPTQSRPQSVRVTASSSDQSVVPDENIVVTGNGSADPVGSFTNGSLDDGDDGWTFPDLPGSDNTAHVWSERSYSAPNALRLDKAGGRAEQTVTGLEPNTTYLLGARYNLELQWDDVNETGRVDEEDSFPDGASAMAWFDLGVEDPAGDRLLSSSVRNRNGWTEQGDSWSMHEDDWSADVQMFTTGADTTEVTFFVDNTDYAGTNQDSNVSIDEVWLQPLVPPNRTVTALPVSGSVGETMITLTAVDEDDQELGTEEFTVTVSDSTFANGGFEARPDGSGWGGVAGVGADVVIEDPFILNRSLELARDEIGTVWQDVTGLQPEADYALDFRGRADKEGGSVAVAVGDYGGFTVSDTIEATEWSPGSIEFTTDSSGSARVYIIDWNVEDGLSMVDDLALAPVESSEPSMPPALPSLQDIADVHVPAGSPVAIPFTASGATLGDVRSDNPDLVPDRSLDLAGDGDAGLLTLTPVPDRTGKALVEIFTDEGATASHEIEVVVSDDQLLNPGFELGSQSWDLTGGGEVVGGGDQRGGSSALELSAGDEVTQLVDGLAYNRDYVIGGWTRGEVEVTVTTRPDASQIPADVYEDEFSTTWTSGEWADNELRFTTTQCPECRTAGSFSHDTTDDDPDSLTVNAGGQVEVTFKGIGADPSFLDDLYILHAPAIAPIRDISLHEDQTEFAWDTARHFSVGRISPQARWDPGMVEIVSSNEAVLPLENVRLVQGAGGHNPSPYSWTLEVRAADGGEQVSGRSEVAVKLTDPTTGLSAEESFNVTINAGDSLNNGDFERGGVNFHRPCGDPQPSYHSWCNAWLNRSFEVIERQQWRYLGARDENLALRTSSGIAGYRVTGLEPETDYVVQGSAIGNAAGLQVRATDGVWDGTPAPIFGTLRGALEIDNADWATTPDLEFTTDPDETEVWLFVWVDCVKDPDDPEGPCQTTPASSRPCARFNEGEICIDDIGIFRAEDLE